MKYFLILLTVVTQGNVLKDRLHGFSAGIHRGGHYYNLPGSSIEAFEKQPHKLWHKNKSNQAGTNNKY